MDGITLRRSGSGAASSATVTKDGWIQVWPVTDDDAEQEK